MREYGRLQLKQARMGRENKTGLFTAWQDSYKFRDYYCAVIVARNKHSR